MTYLKFENGSLIKSQIVCKANSHGSQRDVLRDNFSPVNMHFQKFV